MLFDPYIFQNYVQYESFPYDPEDFLGNETALLNVFTFWKHYQEKYVEQLSEASIIEEEYNKWLKADGQVLKKESSPDNQP